MTYINFHETDRSPSGKTRRWKVMEHDGGQIGLVAWYAPWRKYAFAPWPNTVFEEDCLRAIATFCEDRTREHKAGTK